MAQILNAARYGDAEAVSQLLGDGSDPNTVVNCSSLSILYHVFPNSNYLKITKSLLDQNISEYLISIDSIDTFPIHLAAYNDHLEVVKILIGHRANINAVNDYNLTALHLAALQGHSDIIRFLIDAGANRTIRDKESKTALDLASNLEIQHLVLTYRILWDPNNHAWRTTHEEKLQILNLFVIREVELSLFSNVLMFVIIQLLVL